MKNVRLVFVAMLAMAAFSSTGCIFTSDDDPSSAVFHATWTITDAAGPSTCEAHGIDKTSFLFTGTDAMGHDEVFDCPDEAGDTAPLALDTYTYVVTLLSCPDTSPGCPGGTTIKMSDPTDVTASVDTCDRVNG